MVHLKIIKVITIPTLGSSLNSCTFEASQISRMNNCQVVFMHNGKHYSSDHTGNVTEVTADEANGIAK